MPFEFANEPVPIERAKQLSPETFKHRYRNKHPVILSDVISDWLPLTKWTTPYLQETLEKNCSHGELQVFVSLDNQLFINHPEVIQTVNITPKDFLKIVFGCQDACDLQAPTTTTLQSNKGSKSSEKQRYYLRTHSMPEMLFKDINIPAQIKSLFHVLCFNEEETAGNSKTPDAHILDPLNTDTDDTGEQPAVCSHDEVLSPWEEMLTYGVDWSDVPVDEGLEEGRIVDNSSASADSVEVHVSAASKPDKQNHSTPTQQCEKGYSMSKCCDSYSSKWQDMQTSIFNQSTMQLWVGTRGNVTPLHYDRNHGLLAQIVGRKQLTLFSHEDTPNLYPHVSYSERAHTSRVDLRKVDVEGDTRFPRLKTAQPYTCTLVPGELLYMPPFWWHDVTSLDDCISVTLPWDMDSSEMIPPCMLT